MTGLPSAIASSAKTPCQPGVQLVDDDVGPCVALAGLVVADALDDVEVELELLAGLDHVARALLLAVRGGVDDERPAGCRSAGRGVNSRRSSPGGTTCASGTQRSAA